MKMWKGKVLNEAEVWFLGTIVLDVHNLIDWAGRPRIQQCGDEYISSWDLMDVESGLVWLIAGSSTEPLGAGPKVASRVMTWELYGQSTNHEDLCDLSRHLFNCDDFPPPDSFIQLRSDD